MLSVGSDYMLCGLSHRNRACGSSPSTSSTTVYVEASTTVIVPGLSTPRSSVWPGTASNCVSIQTSPTPGTVGRNCGAPLTSHFCAFSTSVGAIVGMTAATAEAGSDGTPRNPMNGSCSAVTGVFAPCGPAITTPFMYGCTLHRNRYKPGASNFTVAIPPDFESSWSTSSCEP